jgi:hypothetical protein
MKAPRLLLLPLLASLFFAGVGLARDKKEGPPGFNLADLKLAASPAAVARLELKSPDRAYKGPARISIDPAVKPLKFSVEDFGEAEPFEFQVESLDPLRFVQLPGQVAPDEGVLRLDGTSLIGKISRTRVDGQKEELIIAADLAPRPQKPPGAWLEPGTTLYYGRSYDNKPITQVVPMALTVRLGTSPEGDRRMEWRADVDPATQLVITGDRTERGQRTIPRGAFEAATRIDDRFVAGEQRTEAPALFFSVAALKNLRSYGGGSFTDDELGSSAVLVRVGEDLVRVQADGALWEIPVILASAYGGKARYAIADVDKGPLLIAASRPGYRLSLMAIGRP